VCRYRDRCSVVVYLWRCRPINDYSLISHLQGHSMLIIRTRDWPTTRHVTHMQQPRANSPILLRALYTRMRSCGISSVSGIWWLCLCALGTRRIRSVRLVHRDRADRRLSAPLGSSQMRVYWSASVTPCQCPYRSRFSPIRRRFTMKVSLATLRNRVYMETNRCWQWYIIGQRGIQQLRLLSLRNGTSTRWRLLDHIRTHRTRELRFGRLRTNIYIRHIRVISMFALSVLVGVSQLSEIHPTIIGRTIGSLRLRSRDLKRRVLELIVF